MGIAHHVFEQAIAFAHGFFIGQHGLSMGWFERKGRAIKETTAAFGAFDP